jgi:uncharacterized protein (TIGR02246 family)
MSFKSVIHLPVKFACLAAMVGAIAVSTAQAQAPAQAPAQNPTAPATQPVPAATLTPEQSSVDATTRLWMATVTSGQTTVVEDVMALYAPDAVLLATVSEQVRDEPQELRDYFNFFTKLSKLAASDYKPTIRVYENMAINSGYYTFSFETAPGVTKQVPARYTFVYQKVNDKWMIVEHHSSVIPEAPEQLPAAN